MSNEHDKYDKQDKHDKQDKMFEICNLNKMNMPSDLEYKSFNDFIFSKDLKLVGKLLHRFEHFLNIKDLPGDIIEIGSFKGSGLATFLKFVEIYAPRSNKKVIGFDIFNPKESNVVLNKDTILDKDSMNVVYSKVQSNELTEESVSNRLKEISDKFILVSGDVQESLPKFLEKRPGLRVSMLYIDVDLERPTYFALKYLWPRMLTGSVIIFDEFEYHHFSESNGFDKFMSELDQYQKSKINLQSTNWVAPTAYFYKE